MKNINRQFFIILILAIIVCLLFLVYQLSVAEKITIKRSERPLIENSATQIPIDPMDPIIGNQGAPMTITAFIDFNDSNSRRLFQTLDDFIENNPTKIRMVFKDFPATGLFAEDDIKPHIAAFCAKKQNKFTDYANELVKISGKKTDNETLSSIAEKISLQKDAWQSCLNSTEAKTRVDSAVSLAKSIGLKKAPIIFVNNMRVNYLEEINVNDLLSELIKEY